MRRQPLNGPALRLLLGALAVLLYLIYVGLGYLFGEDDPWLSGLGAVAGVGLGYGAIALWRKWHRRR